MAKKNPIDRTDSRVDALVALYVRAEADFAALIYQAMLPGTPRTKKYRNQRRAIAHRLLKVLEGQAIPRARALVRAAYEVGVSEARKALEKPDPSIRKKGTMDVLQDNLVGDLKKVHRSIGRQVDDIFRKSTLLAVGDAEGPVRQPARAGALERRLRKEGIVNFVDKSGRKWKLEHYTRMATATTAAEAVNVGTLEALASRDFDLVDINKIHDPCKRCAPLEGQTYSISGDNPDYEKLPHFPVHPFCRHYASPSRLAMADRRKRQADVRLEKAA